MKPTQLLSSLPLLRFALVLLCFATAPSAQGETLTPDARKELLQKAERWSVPQPGAGSRLLKIWVFQSGRDTDFYALGFVDPKQPDRALGGFEHWYIKGMVTQDVSDPDAMSLDDISPTSSFEDDAHGVNFGLLTGIQLLRRGNEKVGTALIIKALGKESGDHRSSFYSPAGEKPALMLARSCLAAAMNEITSSKPEFPKIKQRIERLIADQPELKSEATDSVLESLAANVSHQPAKDGTIEKIVDDYLLGAPGVELALALKAGEFAPAEKALILKGFEAVPGLLAQRHSKRFTNHLMHGLDFPSYPMRAGQVIDVYLQRLANDAFGPNWLRRPQGYTEDDQAVLKWWKEASALGEEAYVKKNTVIFDLEKNARLSSELLLLAQVRYPALLAGFYNTLLKTSYPSWPVADAILESGAVTREQKVELLEAGIGTNHKAHRNTALRHLRDLDPKLADKHLLKLVKVAPDTAEREYWTDQDAELGGLVSHSRDPEVWRALHALLERADLGMRMELIHFLYPPLDAPAEILRSFHDVYLRFRDDETVRDVSTSKKFSGPGAGFGYHQLAMRDFIRMHWSSWLELKLSPPKEPGTPDEWKAYRDAVDLAIKKQ